MSFNRRKHEGKKPWEVEPFSRLRAVQVYYSGALCEGCLAATSKYLYATTDNQALDLCHGCSEDAFALGVFENRFHIDNYDRLVKTHLYARSSWPKLREPKNGISYNPAA